MKAEVAAVRSNSEEERERGGGASSTENINGVLVQGGNEAQNTSCNRTMSAESQDFEFNKLGGLTSSTSSPKDCAEAGGVQKLASADELFYKGQLLPLQYCSTGAPSYIRSLTSSPISHFHGLLSENSPPSKFPELPLSNVLTRGQDMRFSSCRMDHIPGAMDLSCLFELPRSSSFRSNSTDYSSYYCSYYDNHGPPCSNGSRWDSFSTPSCTTTSGGECSSSSRDSNGSSQDSCMSCPESNTRSEQHAACSCHGPHAPAGMNGRFNPRRKPGLMQSWKILFNGFRKANQSAGGLGNRQGWHHPSSHGSLSTTAAAAVSQGSGAPAAACVCNLPREKARMVNDQVPRSPSRNTASLMWAQGKDQRGKIKASQVISSADHKIASDFSNDQVPRSPSRNTASLMWAQEKDQRGKIKASQVISSADHKVAADFSKKLDEDSHERKGASAASKGSRWQGYTRKINPISMIKATWHGNPARNGGNTAGSSSSRDSRLVAGDQSWQRRVTSPLERKFSQPSLVSTVSGTVKEHSKVRHFSFQFHAVSRSCPASAKSSPNHSGLLVPASPSNLNIAHNMSAMQELHSAVQSAIAHCKQSAAATPSLTA